MVWNNFLQVFGFVFPSGDSMIAIISLMIFGLVILIGGGELLVRGASNIAYRAKISPLVVGLTIVAFGTSAPELFISIFSVLQDEPNLSAGNVVGSNICNLSLVLGVTAIFCPIVVSENSIKIDWLVAFGSAVLFFFFVSGEPHELTRYEGALFIIILLAYTYFLIDLSRKETKLKATKGEIVEEPEELKNSTVVKEIIFVLIGSVAMAFGSEWFVGGILKISEYYKIESGILGLTVVALGTSLPELVTSSIAALKKNTDLAIGNLLGSSIFNILSILGITSIIKPLTIDNSFMASIIWMLGITLLVLPMMISRRKIGRAEGLILLVVYTYYIIQLVDK